MSIKARSQLFQRRVLGVTACLLLAGSGGCLLDETRHWPPPPPPPPPEPKPDERIPDLQLYADRVASLPSEWSEEEKVTGLLSSYCGPCHLPQMCPPEASCAGMEYINDLPRLIEEEKVIPGRPEESLIVLTMIDGSMPPSRYEDVPAELIERVSAFIESLCPSDLPACDSEPNADE